MAQTFTVGIDGILARVDIEVQDLAGVTLDILPTIAGFPAVDDAAALTTIALPTVSSGPGTLVSADVRAFDISLNTGDIFAIALRGDKAWNTGFDAFQMTYAGGSGFVRTTGVWEPLQAFGGGGDLNFRTFVVPEPASVWLFLAGVLGLAGSRLRRNEPNRNKPLSQYAHY